MEHNEVYIPNRDICKIFPDGFQGHQFCINLFIGFGMRV